MYLSPFLGQETGVFPNARLRETRRWTVVEIIDLLRLSYAKIKPGAFVE
jgi:hypothetical protein